MDYRNIFKKQTSEGNQDQNEGILEIILKRIFFLVEWKELYNFHYTPCILRYKSMVSIFQVKFSFHKT